MVLSELKSHLSQSSYLNFKLPNGQLVPSHFHVTEIGVLSKKFVDCGGTFRTEKKLTMQLWVAEDFDHRLAPSKFLDILNLSDSIINGEDLEIEVEYQSDTIGKYQLGFDNGHFALLPTQTDCLAKDQCEVPAEKKKFDLSDLTLVDGGGSCSPGSGCC